MAAASRLQGGDSPCKLSPWLASRAPRLSPSRPDGTLWLDIGLSSYPALRPTPPACGFLRGQVRPRAGVTGPRRGWRKPSRDRSWDSTP